MAGVPCGPVSKELLLRYLTSGHLSGKALVWREGMEDWLPATEVSELAVASDSPTRSVSTSNRRRKGLAPVRARAPKSFLALWILGLGAGVILFFSWKDMNRTLPEFADLQTTTVNTYKMEASQRILSDKTNGYSVEFSDPKGRRYQVNDFGEKTWEKLQKALKEGRTVTARYGTWDAALSSDTIFTVYQLETADEILIPYEKLADAKDFENKNAVWMMLSIVSFIGLVVFLVFKFIVPRFSR